jgi:hypothetical protein
MGDRSLIEAQTDIPQRLHQHRRRVDATLTRGM